MLQHKSTSWSRRASSMEAQDDLPRVDEHWLRQNCQAREVYCEQQRDGFRPEWQHVPPLSELLSRVQSGMGGDTRVVLSEVQISFIPVTEIVFDLGHTPEPDASQPAGKRRNQPRRPDADLYSWYIYGFERRLPGDWRFLNWDRVLFYLMLCLSVLLLVFLILAMLRVRGAF
jgi:hypothetical protein